MKDSDLRSFEELIRNFDCVWVNTGRVSNDWKAKIFERKSDGKQIALYDRSKGFLIRMESFDAKLPGVTNKPSCPKGDGFKHSSSKFKNGNGVCVVAANLQAAKSVLEIYYGPKTEATLPLEQMEQSFQQSVQQSASDAVDKRRERLKTAKGTPSRKQVTVTVFDRNPDVVAERLYLAKGICDDCNNKAPFARASNGQPYLEVHHVLPLSAGGADVVENTVALCPNCHRQRHYG